MAIYQFNLTAIPRASVLKRYEKIPSQLVVDYDERKAHHYKNKDGVIKEDEVFSDALTQDWWSSIEINIAELVEQIDAKVKRADWGNDKDGFNWKTYSDQVDNDASLRLNRETGKVEQLTFRSDLREKGLTFLKGMISLAAKYDWMLMDTKGNLVHPTTGQVKAIVINSNSYRFVINPLEFFTDLENGTIKIE
jgi:hypothetical protein